MRNIIPSRLFIHLTVLKQRFGSSNFDIAAKKTVYKTGALFWIFSKITSHSNFPEPFSALFAKNRHSSCSKPLISARIVFLMSRSHSCLAALTSLMFRNRLPYLEAWREEISCDFLLIRIDGCFRGAMEGAGTPVLSRQSQLITSILRLAVTHPNIGTEMQNH